MATHSSTLAWRIPWTEEPGRLQSTGLRRVGHDWVTSLSFIGEGNGNPLQCSCLENSRDGGAWWAAVYGFAQSRTRLKRLSSSSLAQSSALRATKHNILHNHSTLNSSWNRYSVSFFIIRHLKGVEEVWKAEWNQTRTNACFSSIKNQRYLFHTLTTIFPPGSMRPRTTYDYFFT